MKSFFECVMQGVHGALQAEGPPLLVAHGGVYWAICYQLGIQNNSWKIGNCEVAHFVSDDNGRWEVQIVQG